MFPARVAIIGGGPGGLMTAYFLEKRTPRPCDITIFEAGPRLGGKIVTRRFESADAAYEAGAAELYDYSGSGPDPLKELIAELGLPTRPMAGPTVVLGDRFLRDDADIRRELGPATAKAIADFTRRAKTLISPADYYESDWKEDNEDPLSRKTFAELLDAVPDPVAREYIRVSVHSDLATEPHLTSAAYGLQNYLMNEPAYMSLYTIDGGIDRLPRELAKRLSARTLLNRTVKRVEKTPQGTYRITSRSRGATQIDEFDIVVAALPNNWLPAIEWGGELLAGALRRHHEHYDYPAHYLRVSILFEKPFWRDRVPGSYFMTDAFGGCCLYDESSRDPNSPHGVLGWLLGGDAALNLANYNDVELIEKVLDSLPCSLQFGRQFFREGRVHRYLGAVNGWPAGFPAREPDSRHFPEPTEHTRFFVVGDYLFDSTLNGVLDSADTAVEFVLDEIREMAEENIIAPATAGIA